MLTPDRRIVTVAGAGSRHFGSALSAAAWASIQTGVLKMRYRDIPFLKSPFDICLYLQLLARLRPASVIEIGTHSGGSALWFADMMEDHDIHCEVVSVDIHPRVKYHDGRIRVLIGDALALDAALPAELLKTLPRPWLVIEDSAHRYDTTLAVLQFFDQWLAPGDYIVVEDGIVASLPGAQYQAYEDGPNRALCTFLEGLPDRYRIDTDLCDHFGYNVTYNPNGWLQRL